MSVVSILTRSSLKGWVSLSAFVRALLRGGYRISLEIRLVKANWAAIDANLLDVLGA